MQVYYFHGFGMDETNGGMFTDIASHLGDKYQSVFTAFNKDNSETGYTEVAPLSDQISMVSSRLKEAEQPSIVIAHSQGCSAVANALLQPGLKVSQVILIAPPTGFGLSERFVAYISTLPGAKINLDGDSIAPLPSGKQAIIPSKCFTDMDKYYEGLKQTYAEIPYPLTIIRTDTDDVLGPANDYSDVSLNVITIPNCNHAFTGEFRPKLLEALSESIY